MMSGDRIEKSIDLNAPVDRVWDAITNSQKFGEWFKVKLTSPFIAGQPCRGMITHPGYEHVEMEVIVETIEPMNLFSFLWRPYAIDATKDYSHEPRTLVQFRFEPIPAGTRLTITESGFEGIPADRRDLAFRMNDNGWAQQTRQIETYLAKTA